MIKINGSEIDNYEIELTPNYYQVGMEGRFTTHYRSTSLRVEFSSKDVFAREVNLFVPGYDREINVYNKRVQYSSKTRIYFYEYEGEFK